MLRCASPYITPMDRRRERGGVDNLCGREGDAGETLGFMLNRRQGGTKARAPSGLARPGRLHSAPMVEVKCRIYWCGRAQKFVV